MIELLSVQWHEGMESLQSLSSGLSGESIMCFAGYRQAYTLLGKASPAEQVTDKGLSRHLGAGMKKRP